MLFAARIVDGLSGGNISTARAYVADITEPKDRARAYGIIGAALGKFVFDALGIADFRVRGFALGVAAHGIGTARAFQVNAEAGAFAGLAFGLQGALAAFLFPAIYFALRHFM